MPTEKRARQKANRQAEIAQQARVTQRRTSLLKRAGIVVVIAAVIGVPTYFLTAGSSPSKSSSSTTTSTSSSTSTTAAAGTTAALQSAADKKATAAGCPASTKTRVNTLTWSSAPALTIDTKKTYTADIETDTGSFTIKLNAAQTPQTVNNFVFLADHDFYHCVIFHRVIPGFVDQTGDPTGTGSGGPGYTIPDENPAKATTASQQYALGAVAMANTGQPHSGGSQWFVVAGPQGESLPPSYADFGQVTSGMSTVEQINKEGTPQGVPPKVTYRVLSVHISES